MGHNKHKGCNGEMKTSQAKFGQSKAKADIKGINPELANPLILWCRRSESNRHGVEAPRDFESIPDQQAISRHF